MLGPGRFDPSTGALLSVGSLPVHAFGLDVWRAPIDNDRPFSWTPKKLEWRQIGLDHAMFRVDAVDVGPDALTTRGLLGFPGSDLGFTVTMRWTADDDALSVRVQARPKGSWTTELPRFGLRLALPGDPDQVEWDGFGRGEAYSDSRSGVCLGRWRSSVARAPARRSRSAACARNASLEAVPPSPSQRL